jgi:CRISPR-associated protein Cas5d
MGYGITVRVRGEYALFTRPEMKVERVSYDVITPSAARGIIEAVYWKPAIHWVIDRIHVLNEIEFTNIRRNEVSEKVSDSGARQRMDGSQEPFFIDAADPRIRQQRAALVLKNVDYVIEAHFELTEKAGAEDTAEKHYNMALRRLRKGQYFSPPSLGTREFGAKVELIEDAIIPKSALGDRDLGWMLYDLDFSNARDIKPQFFKAEMRAGVIDLTQVEVKR